MRFTSSLFLQALAMTAALTVAALAQAQQHSDQEIKADAERHRAMAAAHEAAAKCLETTKNPDQCMKDLQAACKNLAIGKYCGMKHVH